MDCWQHEIDRAPTESEVVRIAADYLFLWAPRELASISLGWRDLRIESVADVERMKGWLVEGVSGAHSISRDAAALRELASYIWYAASRIQDLRHPRPLH